MASIDHIYVILFDKRVHDLLRIEVVGLCAEFHAGSWYMSIFHGVVGIVISRGEVANKPIVLARTKRGS